MEKTPAGPQLLSQLIMPINDANGRYHSVMDGMWPWVDMAGEGGGDGASFVSKWETRPG